MSHALHKLPRVIFGDDCEECRERAASIKRLSALDSMNLRKLGALANSGYENGVLPAEASIADEQAVENLRLAARIVFASGIREEAAR